MDENVYKTWEYRYLLGALTLTFFLVFLVTLTTDIFNLRHSYRHHRWYWFYDNTFQNSSPNSAVTILFDTVRTILLTLYDKHKQLVTNTHNKYFKKYNKVKGYFFLYLNLSCLVLFILCNNVVWVKDYNIKRQQIRVFFVGYLCI